MVNGSNAALLAAKSIPGVPVADRRIGRDEPIFFIAEIGINHNQSLDMALKLIDAAANAGCSAAKFQTFRARDLYIEGRKAGTYRLMGKDIPIFDLHTGLEMPAEWIPKLQRHCEERGIVFFSTVVAQEGTDLLEKAGVPAYKISSYDCTNMPLIRTVAAKGKPIILSIGAATLGEAEETLGVIQDSKTPVALMQCIAKYPASYSSANLAVMDTLRSAFQIPVGFSDNGFADSASRIDTMRVPLAAAQAGADLFEIHITLDRTLPGADHGFATEPDELKTMVARMNEARAAYQSGQRVTIDAELWGSSVKRTLPEEQYVRNFAYKCLFSTRAVKAGDKLTPENVAVLRPGQYKRGLEPRFFELVIEKAVARKAIDAFEPITWDVIL